jgi:hypothetical protein
MNFLKCYNRSKQYPKSNVAGRKSVKKKSGSSSRRTRSRRHKSSYISSNLFSKNFYPANYFFQDDYHPRNTSSRVGVNDPNEILIATRNPPQMRAKNFVPPNRTFPQQNQHHRNQVFVKVG